MPSIQPLDRATFTQTATVAEYRSSLSVLYGTSPSKQPLIALACETYKQLYELLCAVRELQELAEVQRWLSSIKEADELSDKLNTLHVQLASDVQVGHA